MTLSGAPPPPFGHPPYAIMPYYLYTIAGKFSVQIFPRHRMRPRPQRGLGWRKGGDKFPKNRFSTEQIFQLTIRSGRVHGYLAAFCSGRIDPGSHENRVEE
jgi:hypothetical protein